MTTNATQIKEQLSHLSQQDRAALALFLLESLDKKPNTDESENFGTLLKRRIREVDEGIVQPIPAEIVHEQLRKKYSQS